MDCCELPAKLPSFPYTWQKELSNLLCEILNTRQQIDCQTVKDCETLTSFNSFTLSGNTLSLSYTDEKGIITTRQQDISGVLTEVYTFNNGLTNFSDLIQLGGTLIKNTEIDLSTFNFVLNGENVIFSDYLSTRTPDINTNNTYLFTDVNGKLNVGDLEQDVLDIVGDYEVPITFDNGLTRTLNNVRLGGDLEENTTISDFNYYLRIDGPKLGLNIIPTFPLHATNRLTDNTVGYFLNNKTIQTDTREYVFGLQGVVSLSGTTDTGDFTTTSGLYGQLNIVESGNYTRDDADFKSILSGVIGYITAQATGGTKLTGFISSIASGINLINDHDYSKIVGFYARRPYSGLVDGDIINTLYAGTIDDYYGLYIEDFGSGSLGTGIVNNKWGVYQDGSTNKNWFKGNTAVGEESPLDAVKLRVTSYGNFNVDGGTVNIDRIITSPANDTILLEKETYASSNRLIIYNPIVGTNTDNTVLPTIFGELGSAVRGSVQYTSQTADVTSAVAGVSASHFLASGDPAPGSDPAPDGGGDITSLIGFIARTPRQLAGALVGDYIGTIQDTFGLFIEPQRSIDTKISTAQVRTWGVFQVSDTDKNYFNGQTGFGTTTPVATAKVQIDSTTQGFLPPRMTEVERLAIVAPAIGLIVYQTDSTEGVYVNSSTGWKNLTMI